MSHTIPMCICHHDCLSRLKLSITYTMSGRYMFCCYFRIWDFVSGIGSRGRTKSSNNSKNGSASRFNASRLRLDNSAHEECSHHSMPKQTTNYHNNRRRFGNARGQAPAAEVGCHRSIAILPWSSCFIQILRCHFVMQSLPAKKLCSKKLVSKWIHQVIYCS